MSQSAGASRSTVKVPKRRTGCGSRRGGVSDGTTCSLPTGIRTGPVTYYVVADSRDQPHKRAQSTNAGTVTTTHGLPTRIARNARAGPVPSTCEAAQLPRPLTIACSRQGKPETLGLEVTP